MIGHTMNIRYWKERSSTPRHSSPITQLDNKELIFSLVDLGIGKTPGPLQDFSGAFIPSFTLLLE